MMMMMLLLLMMMMMMMGAAMARWLGKMVPRLMWFSVQGADQDNVKPSGRSGKNDGCLDLFQFTVQMGIQKGTSRLLQKIRVKVHRSCSGIANRSLQQICEPLLGAASCVLQVREQFKAMLKQEFRICSPEIVRQGI